MADLIDAATIAAAGWMPIMEGTVKNHYLVIHEAHAYGGIRRYRVTRQDGTEDTYRVVATGIAYDSLEAAVAAVNAASAAREAAHG